MQAISLLIIAVGNFIVIIVAEGHSGLSQVIFLLIAFIVREHHLISLQKNEFFLFAGIIGIATLVFAFIGVRYQYVSNDSKVER